LACAALVHAQTPELDRQDLHVPDYFHYKQDTQSGVASGAHGIKIQKWNAIGGPDGYHEGTLKPPMLQKIRIPRGVKYGFTGPKIPYSPPTVQPFWVTSPAHYVVTKGSAQFKFANGTKVVVTKGGMFYTAAGIKHGPIKALGGRAVVQVLADFPPKNGAPPTALNTGASLDQFVFQPQESDYGPPPPIGLPDCITIIPDKAPGVIAAKMEPNCHLPYHFHATGAFYFFTQGALKVGGDIPGKIVTFPSGTCRWARPAWAYGPEISIDSKKYTYFLVLGLPPTVNPEGAPNTPQQDIRNQLPEPAQVIYRNSQYGRTVTPGPEEALLTQKRARRHLRNGMVADGEETVFLQHPYVDGDEL